MAVNLFECLLSHQINLSEFLNWLTNESVTNSEIEIIKSYGCGQGEFVVFFLNHLRDQTASILSSDTSNPTPRKIQTPRRKDSIAEGNSNVQKTKNNSHNVSKELFPAAKGDNLTLNEDNFPSLSSKNLIASTPDTQRKSFSTSEINSLDISDISQSITKTQSTKPAKSTSELSKSYNTPKYSTFENDSKNHPRSDKKNSTSKSSNTSFCLGDFIVSTPAAEKRNTKARKCILQTSTRSDDTNFAEEHESKVSRRIKPTSIVHQNSGDNNERTVFAAANIGNIEPNPVFKVLSVKKDVRTANDRDLLREECLKLRQKNDPPGGTTANQILLPNTPSKILTKTDSNDYIIPQSHNVTNQTTLNIYVEIYSTLLTKNLVLNLVNEIYFLFSLLLIRQVQNEYSNFCLAFEKRRNELEAESKTPGAQEFFHSIHNCVYFAVQVLHRLGSTLEIFDRPILNLLQNNSRIKEFSSELNKNICEIYRRKVENNSTKQIELFLTKNSSGKNVCFISDTDNRSNFPNLTAFQTFRKQRDLFYEILRTWELNHLNANWNFSSLDKSINILMNMSGEPLNFLHLARLFKCQLLNDCGFFNNAFEEDCSFSSALKNINAAKLSLLQSRLVTPQSGDTSNDFPGYQEFYKNFILSVNKPNFLRHLVDSFISEIYQLHQDGFLFQDISLDDKIDSETKYKYTVTVLSLKLLGKFLSFIECLPYSSATTELCSENLISVQLSVRNKVQNQLNIKNFILNAIENRILILTIPWICDYFSQLDYVTIRLAANKKILHILFEIYFRLRQKLQNTNTSAICEISTSKMTINESLNVTNNLLNYIEVMPLESIFLLKLCIGSLFEKPHFPEELYFKWLTNQTNCIELYCAREFLVDELNETNADITTLDCSVVRTNIRKLDLYRIVDEKILYKLCPQLADLKQLLINNDVSNKMGKPYVTARHITPVTTLALNESVAAKQLQLQMEETFFNLHPPSMRKTVDFVIERVTSICVKNICTTLVPNLKSKAKKALYDVIKTIQVKDQSQLESILLKHAREIADKSLLELRSNYSPANLCDERCRSALKALLAPDLHASVVNFCIEYTSRQAKYKVMQWIEAHVASDIFTKHLNELIYNFIATSTLDTDTVEDIPINEIPDEIFENTITPVFTINKIREIIWKFTDGDNPTLDSSELVRLLKDISISISSRNDYTSQIHKEAVYLTLDLALILLTFSPKIMTDKTVVSSFIAIWRTYKDKSDSSLKEKLQFIKSTKESVPVFSEDLQYRQDDLDETIAKKRQENRFSRMVCARNIFMLEQSQDPKSTWLSFGQLLFAMIKDDAIMEASALDAQCTAFFQLEWPQVILKHFQISLTKIIEEYKNWKGSEDEFTLLLEFLAETCERLEDDSLEF